MEEQHAPSLMKGESQTFIDNKEKTPPDGGWGWIIVFAAFMMNFIIWGVLNTSGILYVELLEDLGTGKGETAWISSIAFGTTMLISPVSSLLSSLFGNRFVCLAGSLTSAGGFALCGYVESIYAIYVSFGLVGVGFGLCFLPFLVTIGYYFTRKRSLAMGISVCGTGVGTFVWAPIVEHLIQVYTWRGTTLIMAGVALNLAVFGALLRPVKKSIDIDTSDTKLHDSKLGDTQLAMGIVEHSKTSFDRTKDTEGLTEDKLDRNLLYVEIERSKDEMHTKRCSTKTTTISNFCLLCRKYDFSILTNAAFIMFLLANFTTILGINAPYVYLPDRAQQGGISKTDSALLISVIGIGNTIGRIIFGWLADQKWVKRNMFLSSSLIICGILTILNPLNDRLEYLLCYSALYGSFMGVFSCLYVVILMDLFGLQDISHILSISVMVQGIASLIGPPAAGWLYDITGSYNTSFYCIGAVTVIGGVIQASIPTVKKLVDKS